MATSGLDFSGPAQDSYAPPSGWAFTQVVAGSPAPSAALSGTGLLSLRGFEPLLVAPLPADSDSGSEYTVQVKVGSGGPGPYYTAVVCYASPGNMIRVRPEDGKVTALINGSAGSTSFTAASYQLPTGATIIIRVTATTIYAKVVDATGALVWGENGFAIPAPLSWRGQWGGGSGAADAANSVTELDSLSIDYTATAAVPSGQLWPRRTPPAPGVSGQLWPRG